MARIKFADGSEIESPEGVDPVAFAQQHLANRQAVRDKLQAQYEAEAKVQGNPLASGSALGNLAAGFHRGVRQPIRGALNMLGLVSDETAQREADLEKPIAEASMFSPAGIGNLLGNMGATAPIVAAAGAAAPVLGAAAGAGGMLARPIGQAALIGSMTGAGAGALNARPGERGTQAAIGGVLGGATGAAAQGLIGRLSRGIATTSPEYKALRAMTGDALDDLPLGAKVDPSTGVGRGLKTLYQNVVPNVPLGGRILTQEEAAQKAVMGNLADDIANRFQDIVPKPRVSFSDNPRGFISDLAKGVRNIYRDIGGTQLRVADAGGAATIFDDTVGKVLSGIKDSEVRATAHAFITKATAQRTGGAEVISGDTARKLYTQLIRLRNFNGGSDGRQGAMYDKIAKAVLEWGKQSASSPAEVAAWSKFARMKDASGAEILFNALQDALAAAPQGAASPTQLYREIMQRLSSSIAAVGEGPLQAKTELAHAVLKETGKHGAGGMAIKLGTGGLMAGAGNVGAGIGGPFGAALGAAVPLAAARVASNPSVQRSLVGETASQQALQRFLANNPQAVAMISALLTGSGVHNASQ